MIIKELPDVTLFAVGPHNPAGTLRAVEICKQSIKFGAEVVITDRSIFPGMTRDEGRRNYSHFMVKRAMEYITTSHALIVSDDGYIQNPAAWDDSWLQYDVCGAGWLWYMENCVGNGGFCLRSKKLLDILAQDESILETFPDDDVIGRKYRPYLEEKYGIKYATLDEAKKFSTEGYGLQPQFQVYQGEFGFHGFLIRNLPIPPIR